jgi:hypothetical protein
VSLYVEIITRVTEIFPCYLAKNYKRIIHTRTYFMNIGLSMNQGKPICIVVRSEASALIAWTVRP